MYKSIPLVEKLKKNLKLSFLDPQVLFFVIKVPRGLLMNWQVMT